MNLLMIGSGQDTWSIRGVQLGGMLGARLTLRPTAADCRWADVIVLVKRAAYRWAHQMASWADRPIVWDPIDFWQQPRENSFGEGESKRLFRAHLAQIAPALTMGATAAMAEACDGVYLPHHAWAHLSPTAPVRDAIEAVAYQGNPAYLGRWADRIAALCQARGWRWLINPSDLREADLVVALRDGPWDGWMCREWKSGVKLVNAIAAGRPVITQPSAAWREVQPPGTAIEAPEDLAAACDAWTPLSARAGAYEQARALAPQYTVQAIAAQYRSVLDRVAAGVEVTR